MISAQNVKKVTNKIKDDAIICPDSTAISENLQCSYNIMREGVSVFQSS